MRACRWAATAMLLLLASCGKAPLKVNDSPAPAPVEAPRPKFTIQVLPHASPTHPPAQDITYNSHYPPHFPVEAIVAGHYGVVTLLIRVGATAEIDDIRVEQSSGYAELDAAAVDAAKHWKFMAEAKNGVAVAGWIRVPVSFDRPAAPAPSKAPYASN